MYQKISFITPITNYLLVPLYLKFFKMISLLTLGFLGMGPSEIIIVLIIVLLLFGGKKIPELMKGLGRGVKEFKDASKGENTEIENK